tara:strand:- start:2147 stop:4174 length:2028 start_codon:yes stop_codon:yes gene_type:complete
MLKVLIKGPILSRSGYGEQARFAMRSLRSRTDLFDVYMVNIPWGHTGQISNLDEETSFIHQTLFKTQQYAEQGGQFDVSLQVTVPNEFEKIAPINIGYTAGIETTKVSPQWIAKSNETVDKIIVVSNHSKKVFEQTKYDVKDEHGNNHSGWGLQKPVEVVNYPVRLHDPEEVNIEFRTSKNFLTVSQWGPRKNLENTIKWFVEAFADDEDAGLVVKTNTASDSIIDREVTQGRLEALLNTCGPRKCSVYLIHGEMSPGHLAWLYEHPTMKAMINIGHGEGYGLPLFEAAYHGLPLITTTWSGQMDFICKPNKKGKNYPRVLRVDYDLKEVQKHAVWDGVIQKDSMWAFPKEKSYKNALKEALEKETHWRKEAAVLKNHIRENFTEESLYGQFIDSLGLNLKGQAEIVDDLRERALSIDNPKERATFLQQNINSLDTQVEKISLLKDMFKGEKCYVLSCGPSLTEHDQAKVANLLENNLTLAIKQSYDLFSTLVDFHVYNCGNFKKYDYSKGRPIVMEASTAPYKLGECDLNFFIMERNFDNSISAKNNHDDWTLDKQPLLRPYGPGIMYEAVFYLLQHIGVSEVITIGWDNKLLSDDPSKLHFYDMEGSEFDKGEFIHSNEVASNKAAAETLLRENKITVNAIESWYNWLSENGCVLKIVSKYNPAPENIERIEI